MDFNTLNSTSSSTQRFIDPNCDYNSKYIG